MKKENESMIMEKSVVCEVWTQYFKGLLSVTGEKSAQSTARPGMTVRVFEIVDLNIT